MKMLECRKKASPASVVSCFRPALPFLHQGSVQYHWSRNSPALPSYAYYQAQVVSTVTRRRLNQYLLNIRSHLLQNEYLQSTTTKRMFADFISKQTKKWIFYLCLKGARSLLCRIPAARPPPPLASRLTPLSWRTSTHSELSLLPAACNLRNKNWLKLSFIDLNHHCKKI